MLVKFTRKNGLPFYKEAASIMSVEQIEDGTMVDGSHVKESAEECAKAINVAKLMSLPWIDQKKLKQQIDDPGIAGMVPMMMLGAVAMGAFQ